MVKKADQLAGIFGGKLETKATQKKYPEVRTCEVCGKKSERLNDYDKKLRCPECTRIRKAELSRRAKKASKKRKKKKTDPKEIKEINMRLFKIENTIENIAKTQAHSLSQERSFRKQLIEDIRYANQEMLKQYSHKLKPEELRELRELLEKPVEFDYESWSRRVVFSYLKRFHSGYHKVQDTFLVRRYGEMGNDLHVRDIITFKEKVWDKMLEEGLLAIVPNANRRILLTPKAIRRFEEDIRENPNLKEPEYYIKELYNEDGTFRKEGISLFVRRRKS